VFADVLQHLFRTISVRRSLREIEPTVARTIRNSKIDTRSARLKLLTRREPYWTVISAGCALGYRRGAVGGFWIARFRDDIGFQHYESLGGADDARDADNLTVFSFAEAQALARAFFERKAREIAGDFVRTSGPFTVADAIESYLTAYEQRGGKSLDLMISKVRTYILPQLGPQPVAKLAKARIERWLHEIAESPARVRTRPGASQRYGGPIVGPDGHRKRKATANRVLTVLKAALNHAYQEGRVLHDDAWRRVKPFREADAARVCYLPDEDCRRLVAVCDPAFRKLVVAALLTGCRYAEITNLIAEDFNETSGTVRIRTSKSGKPRHVVLTNEGRSFFERQVAGKRREAHLFVKSNGQRWKRADQRRPLASACAKIGFENVTFHGFRHTYASRLAMKGVPFAVIAAQLGHADTRMVEKHYGHLAPSYVADTVRAAFGDIGLTETENVIPLKATA
jgi:integrase